MHKNQYAYGKRKNLVNNISLQVLIYKFTNKQYKFTIQILQVKILTSVEFIEFGEFELEFEIQYQNCFLISLLFKYKFFKLFNYRFIQVMTPTRERKPDFFKYKRFL